MLGTILVVILLLLLIGVLPRWPHMDRFELGYQPSAWLGLLLVVVVILVLTGRL